MQLKSKIVIAVVLLFYLHLGINAQQHIARIADDAHILFRSQKYKEAAREFEKS